MVSGRVQCHSTQPWYSGAVERATVERDQAECLGRSVRVVALRSRYNERTLIDPDGVD